MKSGILVFNTILLILIAILFYLHFSGKQPAAAISPVTTLPSANTTGADKSFRIAYFEMDSLENSFAMVKEVKEELSRKERAMNGEMVRLEQGYKNKLERYQGQAATMNQVQSEMATKDMMQMQQQIQGRKQALDQEYQDFYMRKMKDVKTKIEDYLREYNTARGYSFIFAYEPGLFYYRDTLYDITGDVISGLNQRYKKK